MSCASNFCYHFIFFCNAHINIYFLKLFVIQNKSRVDFVCVILKLNHNLVTSMVPLQFKVCIKCLTKIIKKTTLKSICGSLEE